MTQTTEKIKFSDLFKESEGYYRWHNEDNEKIIWEPFADYEWDDLDEIIYSHASSLARILEKYGNGIDWHN